VSRKVFAFAYFFAAIGLVVLGYCCSGDKEEGNKNESQSKWLNVYDSVSYMGMNTCRKCHEDKFGTFIHTGMGESFGIANPQKSAGKFPVHGPLYDKYKDLYYLPYWKDTVLMLKEFRMKGGDTVYSRTERIDYIIGSGQHTNSHIVNQNGYLYQAPFTFYTQSGKLDFPPGFENGNNTRFSRALNEECLTCHNAFPGFVKGSFNKYTSVPLGIDCERCHGPGALHVKEKLAGNVVDIAHDTDFTIVNPRKLPQELQLDVCQRCHLQGDAVLNEGKTFFDHRPGMPLNNVVNVFRPQYENEDKFIMASHAERMGMSPCYLQTVKNGGIFTCVTCHNPHVSVRVTDISFFIQKCQGCHQSVHQNKPEWTAAKKETNCITCHMPKNSTTDIPHVSVTDHYIHIVKKGEQQRVGTEGELGEFKRLASLTTPNPDALLKAKAFMYLYEKYDRKLYHLDSAKQYLSKYTEKDEPAAYIYYYYLRDDFRSIVNLISKEKPVLKNAVSNYQAGRTFENLQASAQALPFFQKAVQLLPYELNYRNQLGTTLMKLDRIEEAEKEFDFVLKENPKIGPAWNNKGFIYLLKANAAFNSGQNGYALLNEAEMHFKKSLSLDPDDAESHLNMAKVWLARENIPKAKSEIETVLQKNPNHPAAVELMSRIKSFENGKRQNP
jgi:tetratricopeptide (TPR) repeat protein